MSINRQRDVTNERNANLDSMNAAVTQENLRGQRFLNNANEYKVNQALTGQDYMTQEDLRKAKHLSEHGDLDDYVPNLEMNQVTIDKGVDPLKDHPLLKGLHVKGQPDPNYEPTEQVNLMDTLSKRGTRFASAFSPVLNWFGIGGNEPQGQTQLASVRPNNTPRGA